MNRGAWWATVCGVTESWTWATKHRTATLGKCPRSLLSLQLVIVWRNIFVYICAKDIKHLGINFIRKTLDA